MQATRLFYLSIFASGVMPAYNFSFADAAVTIENQIGQPYETGLFLEMTSEII